MRQPRKLADRKHLERLAERKRDREESKRKVRGLSADPLPSWVNPIGSGRRSCL